MAKFRKSSITDSIKQSLLLQTHTNVTFGFRSAVVCALLLRGHRADRCQPVVQRRLQDDHRVVPRRLFPPHRHCHARLHRSFPVSSQSRVWVPPFEVGKWGKGLLQTFYLPTYLPHLISWIGQGYCSVWPEKNRPNPINGAQKWSHTFTKIA